MKQMNIAATKKLVGFSLKRIKEKNDVNTGERLSMMRLSDDPDRAILFVYKIPPEPYKTPHKNISRFFSKKCKILDLFFIRIIINRTKNVKKPRQNPAIKPLVLAKLIKRVSKE